MLVHVIHDAAYSRNGEAFVFPLFYNRRRLQDYGVRLTFSRDVGRPVVGCDVLCVSSRCFRSWWKTRGADAVLAWLARARQSASAIVWFDVSDSTGTTQFSVLPLVDAYVKNQVLRNRARYRQRFYGMRITTDFYHRQFHVDDAVADEAHLNEIPAPEQLHKIRAGWNYGMVNHDANGHRLGRLWHEAPWLPRWYSRRWTAPDARRPLAYSCRIGRSYPRRTVAFPRERILDVVGRRIDTTRVSRRQYFAELRRSVAAISPFGFGEVCYRDFEIVLSGAAMMKQDMSHLETWPDLWADERYMAVRWDLSDLEEKLQWAIDQPAAVSGIALRAQQRYREVLTTERGHDEFCARFTAVVAGQPAPQHT